MIIGPLTLTGAPPPSTMLTIGNDCRINSPLFLELSAPVTIGNNVAIGHHVVFITTDHELGSLHSRAGSNKPSPIVIENGVWIGASSTILPGVTIGAGSVVAAGSLVHQSVPPNKVVGGMPARVVKAFTE